jgi:flagellar motor switch protein FliM
MKDEPILRPEEIAGVLSGGAEDGAAAAATNDDGPKPYSLREPVSIPPAAEAQARDNLANLVNVVNESFRAQTGAPVELGLDALQQQPAAAALAALPSPVWVASLARAGGGGLSLALPSVVALGLVDVALGGTGAFPESGREPTPLESRVVSRLLSGCAGPIAELLDEPLKPVALTAGEVPSAVASSGETVGVGLLRFAIGEASQAALLLITASMLLPTETTSSGGHVGPLAARLERLDFPVRPVLRAGRVGFRDLTALEKGKMLRLDAAEDALLELRIFGQTIAWGRVERNDDGSVFRVEQKVDQPGKPGRKDQ